MSNQIVIPNLLLEHKQYCLKINKSNKKIFEHVDYVRQLVLNVHQIYISLCKKMTQLSEQYQRKISQTQKTSSGHIGVILQFIKTINFIHISISNQSNNNNITLGTKTHKMTKNRLEILQQKLLNTQSINNQYIEQVKKFNQKQIKYQQMCSYFKDFGIDVLKYYSLHQNTERYQKISQKNTKLKLQFQQIHAKKYDYQTNINQIRVTLKQYYDMQKSIVSQCRKMISNIRKLTRTSNTVYNQPILQQASGQMMSTVIGQILHSRRGQKKSQNIIVSQRKQIQKQFDKMIKIQELFQQFLKQFQQNIKNAAQKLDNIREGKQYKNFISQRVLLAQILAYQTIIDIDVILNEISTFRLILINMINIFGKVKVLKQIKKYRGYNFEKIIDQYNNLIDIQKKGSGNKKQIKQQIQTLQNKFQQTNQQFIQRYRERIQQIQQLIIAQYSREEGIQDKKLKNKFKNDIFQKAYYQILIHPFFLKPDNQHYKQNQFVIRYLQNLQVNQIQKLMTFSEWNSNKKQRWGCCGLISSQDGPKVIDQFHCSLKDGIILINGKLKLLRNYINFTSNFNPKTFFGYSDIRVPKWQIQEIIQSKHLLSLLILIKTRKGVIQFTSFLTNPSGILHQLYDSNKNGVSLFKRATSKNQHFYQNQLVILQQRFQSQFQNLLLRQGIIIDKLSTYLSQDKIQLSVSTQYHFTGMQIHAIFQIKIIQKDILLQYFFMHDDKCKNSSTKSKLQNLAKQLINKPSHIVGSPIQKDKNNLQLQFSIIQGSQNNKLSFHKQPSFIKNNQKQQKNINGSRCDIDIANLLSSRLFGSAVQTNHISSQDKLQCLKISQQSRMSLQLASQKSMSQTLIKQQLSSKPDCLKKCENQMTILEQQKIKKTKHSKSQRQIKKQMEEQKGLNLATWIILIVIILNIVVCFTSN